jgi:hypothetical protein
MSEKRKRVFVVGRSDSPNSFVAASPEELLASIRLEIQGLKESRATMMISTKLLTSTQIAKCGEFEGF